MWGQYRNDTAPLSNEPKLGFTGHQYDPETGLVYARARYYDPDLGRFISRDSYEGSLTDAPSLHRFAYAWMNPLRYWDRTGFCTEGQDEGCTLSLWDTLAAAAEAATSDSTYADATAARRDQNSQVAAAKKKEEEARESENGPGTWKRIRTAVGEAAAAVGQAWDESRVGKALNRLDDAGRKWSREKSEHALDGLPGGLNGAEAEQLEQVEGGSLPEQYADRNQLAGDLGETGYVATRDAVVTKGIVVGAGVRVSRGSGALTRAEAKALAAEENAAARAANAQGGAAAEHVVGRHGEMPSPRPDGWQSHHGVNSVWVEENVPGARGRAKDMPAVLMPNDPDHNATRAVFNRWRSEMAARQGVPVADLDWSRVSPGEAWRLAEEQFAATHAPPEVVDEYFRQFNQYLEQAKRK